MNQQFNQMMATLTPQQQQMYLQQLQMQNAYMTGYGMGNTLLMPDEPAPSPKKEIPKEPPKPEKLRVKLKPSERGAYSSLFDVACGGRSGTIDGKEAAAFLKRSGLPQSTLKEIWEIADQNSEMALNRDNFYIALRLVALAQNGRDVSVESIMSDIDVPLPKFGGALNISTGPRQESSFNTSSSKYSITEEDAQKYAQLCSTIDAEQKGYLNTGQMDMILAKLNVPPNVGNTLKVICDEQGTDKFPIPMAVVVVHLAILSLKKVPLPRAVPPELKSKIGIALGLAKPTSLPMQQPESINPNMMPMVGSGFPGASMTGVGMNVMGPMNMPSMSASVPNNDALGIIRKEISDKRAEIAELRNEESKLKTKVEQLKERNRTFGEQLQRMKGELANLKRSQGSSNIHSMPNSYAVQSMPMATHSVIYNYNE